MNSLWQAMPGARDKTEQLRAREDKVEDLRHEEEDHGLGEMSLDGNGRESHTGEIAERVAGERAGGVPGEVSCRHPG